MRREMGKEGTLALSSSQYENDENLETRVLGGQRLAFYL